VTVHVTHSEADTTALGRRCGEPLTAGSVVLLDGPLGAGKTAFVRGLAEGLGCNPDDVSSPTFTIVQEYPGRTTLQHVDLYRLESREVADLLLDELLDEAVLAVEWPDRWADPPTDAIRVRFEVTGPTERRVSIVPADSSGLLS